MREEKISIIRLMPNSSPVVGSGTDSVVTGVAIAKVNSIKVLFGKGLGGEVKSIGLKQVTSVLSTHPINWGCPKIDSVNPYVKIGPTNGFPLKPLGFGKPNKSSVSVVNSSARVMLFHHG